MAKKPVDRDNREDPHRQILPELRGEAVEIYGWLQSLFDLSPKDTKPGVPKSEPDSMPESIVLCPVVGTGGAEKLPQLHAKTWKPMSSPVPADETLVQLANEFLGKAKKHCAVNTKRGQQQRYTLFAYNNLKGPDAYSTHPFVLQPGPKEYKEGEAPASDDGDTHRDRLLSASLAHNRWQTEQFAEAMSGVVSALMEDKRQQRDEIAQLYAERRTLILTAEEALSRKQEREERAATHAIKMEVIGEAVKLVKDQVVPALAIYLSKGKVGIAEAVKGFIAKLSETERLAVFGAADENGVPVYDGILNKEQMEFLEGIITKKVEGKRLPELLLMMHMEQLDALQKALPADKMKMLTDMAQAAASGDDKK